MDENVLPQQQKKCLQNFTFDFVFLDNTEFRDRGKGGEGGYVPPNILKMIEN